MTRELASGVRFVEGFPLFIQNIIFITHDHFLAMGHRKVKVGFSAEQEPLFRKIGIRDGFRRIPLDREELLTVRSIQSA